MLTPIPEVLNDKRWLQLQGPGVDCSCGEHHVQLFPIHLLKPINWPGSSDYEPKEALRMDGDFLSYEYAVRDGKYFCIRMMLPLPIRGIPDWAGMIAVWCAVNRPDFEAYVADQKAGTLKDGAKAPARLVNNLAAFPDSVSIMGVAQQNPQGLPMFLSSADQEGPLKGHPLITEQRQGVTLDRLFEIYAHYNHDMRPHFS